MTREISRALGQDHDRSLVQDPLDRHPLAGLARPPSWTRTPHVSCDGRRTPGYGKATDRFDHWLSLTLPTTSHFFDLHPLAAS